jgi:hypothetical protein
LKAPKKRERKRVPRERTTHICLCAKRMGINKKEREKFGSCSLID